MLLALHSGIVEVGEDGTAEITFEKTVWMPHGYNQTVIRYALNAPPAATVELRVRPFVSGRDFHHLQQRNDQFDTRLHFQTNIAGGQEITLRPYQSSPPIQFAHDGAFQADGHWYFDFLYEQESERGLDDREDLYTPGEFVWRLQGGQSALLSLSSEPLHLPAQQKSVQRLFLDGEIARRNGLTSAFANSESETAPTIQRLVRAADQFLVRRQEVLRQAHQ